jgi:hypothetical protein
MQALHGNIQQTNCLLVPCKVRMFCMSAGVPKAGRAAAAMVSLTALEHTAIGAMAGVAEAVVLQPVIGWKNARQEGRPVPRSISALYRGLGVSKPA